MFIAKPSLKDTPEGEQTLCFSGMLQVSVTREITSLSYLVSDLCSPLNKEVYEIFQQQQADCKKIQLPIIVCR